MCINMSSQSAWQACELVLPHFRTNQRLFLLIYDSLSPKRMWGSLQNWLIAIRKTDFRAKVGFFIWKKVSPHSASQLINARSELKIAWEDSLMLIMYFLSSGNTNALQILHNISGYINLDHLPSWKCCWQLQKIKDICVTKHTTLVFNEGHSLPK